MPTALLSTLLGSCAILVAYCARSEAVVDGRAIASKNQGGNWLSVGRTYSEDRFSPLTGINDQDVRRLGLAWYLDLPNQGPLQATPLAVDGVLYFTGMMGYVYAADGRTGKLLWQFDPDLAHHVMDAGSVIWNGNRGVAFWNGKVYVGTVDGRLVALDSKTGRIVWTAQTFDEADNRKAISGAPRAFNGKVIIGHSGDTGGTRGYVTTYDAENGRKLWRFYSVPGNPAKGFENNLMAMAAKTWHGDWWKQGGNGSVWDSITYDPDFNRVYLATANGIPVNANERGSGGGDNLFVASIVALDADTGRYIWHYQVNPGEMWDYDATEQMVLADLTIGGKPRKVLMQAPKNGFFYVIDRTNGKVISAEKFAKATWAERIDLVTGRPVENPSVRYKIVPIRIWPGAFGAHNWQAMSFDTTKRLMYIPTMKLGMQIGGGANSWSLNPQEPDDGTASLLAWDPVTQRKRWEVPLGDSFWNGGTLATAGNLVFQGTASGYFCAYNATTGEKLWSFYAGLGINAAPITYAVDGVQFVAILVGYGGTINVTRVRDYGWRYGEQPRRLLAFALGTSTPLPPGEPPRFTVKAIDDTSFVIDPKLAEEGATLYSNNCALCHGIEMRNIASFARDLRESTLASNWEGFESVVHGGAYFPLGMPKFDELSGHDLRALYMYIRQAAREAVHSVPSR